MAVFYVKKYSKIKQETKLSPVLGKILCKSILSTSTSNQPKKYLKYKYKYII